MSGPVQWTPAGFVVPRTGADGVEPKPAVITRSPVVLEDEDDVDEHLGAGSHFGSVAKTLMRQPQASPKVVTIPTKPVDVVKLAKARLREIERALREAKKLEREREQLRRLIDAADGKVRGHKTVIDITTKRTAG